MVLRFSRRRACLVREEPIIAAVDAPATKKGQQPKADEPKGEQPKATQPKATQPAENVAETAEAAPPSPLERAVAGLRRAADAAGSRMRAAPRTVLAVALVLLVVAGANAVDGLAASGKVRHGVRVGGVDLGGLGRADAEARLTGAVAALAGRPLTVRAGEASAVVPRLSAGIVPDVRATVDAALAVGRDAPLGLDPDRLRTAFGGVELPWRTTTDPAALSALLRRLHETAAHDPEEPAVKVAGTKVTFTPGAPGRQIDRAGATRVLTGAVMDPAVPEATLPVVSAPTKVADAAASATADRLRRLLAEGITVAAAGKTATLTPADLGKAVKVEAAGDQLQPSLDGKRLDAALRRRASFAYTAGKNASFKLTGTKVRVVPSRPGRAVALAEAGAMLLAAGEQTGAARRVELPVSERDPSFATADAEKLGITERVATFTTQFNASDAPRVHNIDLIGRALDGKIVKPGQTFSMNGATGERTVAKGYRTAHILMNGESVEGLGGGVCQAGTTFFNAVFFGGYDIIQRTNHSLHLSRYPLGRDATLDWPTKDVKFRNDSPHGILIRAWVRPASMTVSLYSTSLKTKVTFTTSAPSNYRSPPTRYEDDPTLPKGTEEVKASGSSGFDVTVIRVVKRAGKVVHRDTFLSQYSPWHRIILRGTGGGPEGGPGGEPRTDRPG